MIKKHTSITPFGIYHNLFFIFFISILNLISYFFVFSCLKFKMMLLFNHVILVLSQSLCDCTFKSL